MKKYLLILSALALLVGGCSTSSKKASKSDALEVSVSKNLESPNFIQIINGNHAIVHTQIVINAPVEKVWKTATNFKNMKWTPVFKGLSGRLKDGNTVKLKINNNGKIALYPQKLTWVKGQRFGWKGASPYGDFLHDNHMYYFVALSKNKTLLIQSDQPTSTDLKKINLKDPKVIELLKGNVVNNYMAFNLGLKKYIEGSKNITQPEPKIEILGNDRSANKLQVYNPYRATNHAEIVINAPASKVWEVVTDFKKFPEWSSTYQNLVGPKKPESKVDLFVKDPDGKVTKHPQRLRWVQDQRFGWSGPSVPGGHAFDNHMFMVIPMGENKTLFIQTDDLTNADGSKLNLTDPKILPFLKMVAERNFSSFNKELKKRVESL